MRSDTSSTALVPFCHLYHLFVFTPLQTILIGFKLLPQEKDAQILSQRIPGFIQCWVLEGTKEILTHVYFHFSVVTKHTFA